MANQTSPAITMVLEFTDPHKEYIDYTNREEAVDIEDELTTLNSQIQTEDYTEEQLQELKIAVPEQALPFKSYIDYMNREAATKFKQHAAKELTAVFTQKSLLAPKTEVQQLKDKLDLAYENGSLLWKGVVSFDNEFLAKQGLFDKETGRADQRKIKEVIRDAMPAIIKQEGLSDSAFWWGNIHINTDNIHVHVGISEVESARKKIYYAPNRRMELKGKFSQKTIKNLKSKVFHGLLHAEQKERILRKEQVIANLKTDLLSNVLKESKADSKESNTYLEQAFLHLPEKNKNHWRFGSNAKDFAVSKFYLNKYIDFYFEHEGKEEYTSFLKESGEFLLEYQQAYTALETGRDYERLRYVNQKEKRWMVTTAGFDLEGLMNQREAELRERIGNRILTYFKESPRAFQSEETNISDFSKRNQEAILRQYPPATLIKTKEMWKKEGYSVSDDAQEILVLVPVMEKNEAGEEVDKVKEFISVPYFDRNHTLQLQEKRQVTLSECSFLSAEELAFLIDHYKEMKELSPLHKSELGIYRYALRLKALEAQRETLRQLSQQLDQIVPLESDAAFVSFKQAELQKLQEILRLQATPNWKLTTKEKAMKKQHAKQSIDVVQLPVSKATSDLVNTQIQHISTELHYAQQVRDHQLFTVIGNCTKLVYLQDCETKLKIVKTKHEIFQNNHLLTEAIDSDVIRAIKRENGKKFQALKGYYSELSYVSDPLKHAEEKIKAYGQSRSPNVPAPEEKHSGMNKQLLKGTGNRPAVLGSSRRGRNPKIAPSFAQGLQTALKGSKNQAMRALMKRIRDDEREDQEEQKRNAHR